MPKWSKHAPPSKGSIQFRGPAQFRARIMVKGQSHAQTFDSEAAARAWLDALSAHVASPDKLARAKAAQALTLAEALTEYAQHHCNERGRPDTIQRVKGFIEREAALTAERLVDVDEGHIADLIRRRRQAGKAPATINNDLAFVASAFRIARIHMGCRGLRNPAEGMRFKLPKKTVRRLSAREEQSLYRAAARFEIESPTGVPILSIIQFAIATAMRRSEIARLDWEHINLHRATAHLPRTKNEDARTVALSPPALTLLHERGPQEAGVVWSSYQQIGDAWTKVRAMAAMEHPRMLSEDVQQRLKFHHLRHEGTSRLFEMTDLADGEIATITGHRSNQSLWIYRHLRADRTAAKLAAAWAKEQAATSPGLALVGGTEASRRDVEAADLPTDVKKRNAWRVVSADASILGALVQAKPIREIALDFNISDVAVHKACERLGVTKLPRGHWLKRAG